MLVLCQSYTYLNIFPGDWAPFGEPVPPEMELLATRTVYMFTKGTYGRRLRELRSDVSLEDLPNPVFRLVVMKNQNTAQRNV